MSFLKKIQAKYKLTARDLLKVAVGDVFEIVQGPNPHKKGAEDTVVITVVTVEDDGFYYFYGDKKPEVRERLSHSNSLFVWGIKSSKKIGKANFKIRHFKNVSWTVTGIPWIDKDLANLDKRYQLFIEYAPKRLKSLYDRQEDKNYHSENARMVKYFAEWLAAGEDPLEFRFPPT